MGIKYHSYKRGQVILINFKPSLGYEISGTHFAIVLTKKDSPNNGVLTVLPLSSKKKNYYLNLGDCFVSKVMGQILTKKDEIQKRHIDLLELKKPSEISDYMTKKGKLYSESVQNDTKTLALLSTKVKEYQNKQCDTFAMTQNITSLSKFKIIKYSKNFDPLKLVRVEDSVLDKIDREIVKHFTSINLTD